MGTRGSALPQTTPSRRGAPLETIVIRPFAEHDREEVREIFRQHAQRGNPLRVYVEDEHLVRPILLDYYLDYEPDCSLVAEVNGTVAGYIVGSKDTKRYTRFLALRVLPRLVCRVVLKILTFQYRERRTYSTIWWFLTRAWRELPRPPLDRYPAHCHLAIVHRYRHLLLGRQLVDALAHHLRNSGIPGLHGIVLEEAGKDALARALDSRVLAVRRTTVWDKWTGKRWDAKLLVREL